MITVCDVCHKEFKLKQPQEQQVQIGRTTLTLVYFTCPECNKIYKVCLQDTKYFQLQEDLKKAKSRIRRNRGRNNGMYEMLVQVASAKQAKLKRHVEVLNGKYTGTFTFGASENNTEEQHIIYLP